MARKCHRQGNATHFIFVGEQFWGRAAPGVLDSKEFGTLVNFWDSFLFEASAIGLSSVRYGSSRLPAFVFSFLRGINVTAADDASVGRLRCFSPEDSQGISSWKW